MATDPLNPDIAQEAEQELPFNQGMMDLSGALDSEIQEPAEPEIEETQVAGGGIDNIKAIVKAAAKPKPQVAAPIAKTAADVVRPATEQQVQSFATEMGMTDEHDFDFEAVRTAEDLELARKAMAEIYKPQIEKARRGKIKHEQTLAMAEELDMMPQVLERRVGEIWPAEEIVSARMLRHRSEIRTDQLALKALGPDASARDMLEFRRQFTMHALIDAQVSGATAEIGRALNSFNIDPGAGFAGGLASPIEMENERMMLLLQTMGGETTTRKLAEKWLTINSTQGKSKLARGSFAAKAHDVFFEMWINGLLSGGRTHIRNTIGNSIFKLWSIPETAIAGTIGGARSGISIMSGQGPIADRVFMGEAVAEMFGNVQGIQDGFALGWHSFRTGEASDPSMKVEQAAMRAISGEIFNMTGKMGKAVDYLGTAIQLPGRALIAGDEFFKAVAGRGHLYRLGYRRAQAAIANGQTPEEAVDLATESIVNPDDQLRMDVQQASRYYTYTDEIEGEVNKTVEQFQRIPVIGRFVIPFRRTPLNLIKRFSERTPMFAALMPSVREDFAAGGAKRDAVLSRLFLGSAALTMAGMWALEDKITGGGPEDPRTRQMLRETGWQPWSYKLKKGEGWISDANIMTFKAMGLLSEDAEHYYVSYQGLDPLSGFLAISSDTADKMKWSDDMTLNSELAGIALASTMEFFKDRSFFRGLSDLSNALKFGPKAFNRYLSRIGGSLKPYSSLVRDLERMGDPTRRDTRVDPEAPIGLSQFYAFLNGWKESVPGLSGSLPAQHNYMGEEVKIGGDSWWEMINPFYVSPAKYAPLEDEMIFLGIPFGIPGKTLAGIPLNAEEHQRYIELQGAISIPDGYNFTQRDELQAHIASADYQDLTPEDRFADLRNIHRDYLDEAQDQLVLEYPELGLKIEMLRMMKEEGIVR